MRRKVEGALNYRHLSRMTIRIGTMLLRNVCYVWSSAYTHIKLALRCPFFSLSNSVAYLPDVIFCELQAVWC